MAGALLLNLVRETDQTDRFDALHYGLFVEKASKNPDSEHRRSGADQTKNSVNVHDEARIYVTSFASSGPTEYRNTHEGCIAVQSRK